MTGKRRDRQKRAEQDQRDRGGKGLDGGGLVEAAGGRGKTASVVEGVVARRGGEDCEQIRTLGAGTDKGKEFFF